VPSAKWPPLKLTIHEPKLDEDVYTLGHPSNLPLKLAAGGRVREVLPGYFKADLNTFRGNSGSPVFVRDGSHPVAGILIQGHADWEIRGNQAEPNQLNVQRHVGEIVFTLASIEKTLKDLNLIYDLQSDAVSIPTEVYSDKDITPPNSHNVHPEEDVFQIVRKTENIQIHSDPVARHANAAPGHISRSTSMNPYESSGRNHSPMHTPTQFGRTNSLSPNIQYNPPQYTDQYGQPIQNMGSQYVQYGHQQNVAPYVQYTNSPQHNVVVGGPYIQYGDSQHNVVVGGPYVNSIPAQHNVVVTPPMSSEEWDKKLTLLLLSIAKHITEEERVALIHVLEAPRGTTFTRYEVLYLLRRRGVIGPLLPRGLEGLKKALKEADCDSKLIEAIDKSGL